MLLADVRFVSHDELTPGRNKALIKLPFMGIVRVLLYRLDCLVLKACISFVIPGVRSFEWNVACCFPRVA